MIRITSTKQGLSIVLSELQTETTGNRMGMAGFFGADLTREKTSHHRTKPKLGWERASRATQNSRK